MDACLNNEIWGYYSTGKVNFRKGGDFFTYPVMLSPYFGQMLAEQAFKMWAGMRKARTLDNNDIFTILEFGGGDGTVAFDTLEHIKNRAKDSEEWRLFWQQLEYVIGEYSPKLRELQLKKNKIFGDKFDSQIIDARRLDKHFTPNSKKGLIFSNELLDAFPAHKVRFYKDGRAEAAIAIPAVRRYDFLRPIGDDGRAFIDIEELEEDKVLREKFGLKDDHIIGGLLYLTKKSFMSIKEKYVLQDNFADHMMFNQFVEFTEQYIDVKYINGLSEFIQENADEMKNVLAQTDSDSEIVYLNIGAANFIKAAGTILDKGYCITIDYGDSTAEVIRTPDSFRGYQKRMPLYDPYQSPGSMDLMSIVDFTRLGMAGQDVDLTVKFFGGIAAFRNNTSVNLRDASVFEQVKSTMQDLGIPQNQIASMTAMAIYNFEKSRHQLNMLVQQEEGTDDDYSFEERNARDKSSPIKHIGTEALTETTIIEQSI